MEHKFFPNRFSMWKYLEPQCDGLDLNKTLMMRILSFADQEKQYLNYSMRDFAESMNSRFGTNINPTLSNYRGQKVTLFFGESEVETPAKVEPLIELESAVNEAEIIEEVIVEKEAVIETKEVSEDYGVDWEWVESLKNSKYDKIALDEYAAEKFDITLNRVMKIENMIKDFKEKLAEKFSE